MQVIKKVRSEGFDIFIVGGSIRDLLLDGNPKDWDLATNMHLQDLSKLFEKEVIASPEYQVLKLDYKGTEFQIAQLRNEGNYKDGRHPQFIQPGATLKEDSKRRDLTVNGIYYDPIKSKIIDHVDGMNDIKKRQIKTIGDPSIRFSEDHLRILRAIRIAGKLNFKIEEKTFNSILDLSRLTKKISGERVEHEITSMLLSNNAFESIELLTKSTILHHLFSKDLSLLELNTKFLENLKRAKKKIQMASSTSSPVAWAIFLRNLYSDNDVRKDSIEIIPKKNSIYDEISNVLKLRLKFNNTDRTVILAILQNQSSITDPNKEQKKIWKKTLIKPFFQESLEFFSIMHSSKKNEMEILRFWMNKLQNTNLIELNPKKFIKGDDLLKLGFKEGPRIEEILAIVEEEQLEERIKNKGQAIEFVQRKYINKSEIMEEI